MKSMATVGSTVLLAAACGCAGTAGPAIHKPLQTAARAENKVATVQDSAPRTEAPQPAPRILRGRIEGNLYIAQDSSFTVTVPHEPGSNEFRQMLVKEQYHELGAYVSFGPAASDQSIYRIETYRRINPETSTVKFEDAAGAIVGNYRGQLENGYRAQALENERGDIRVNGLRMLYWNFLQQLPPGSRPQGRDTGDRLSHWVYVIDGPKSAALLWVEIPASCNCPTGWSQDTKTIYKGVDRFVKSFQFLL